MEKKNEKKENVICNMGRHKKQNFFLHFTTGGVNPSVENSTLFFILVDMVLLTFSVFRRILGCNGNAEELLGKRTKSRRLPQEQGLGGSLDLYL